MTISIRDHMHLELRRIRADDWDWIKHWARDPVLDRELGPIDGEWLHHVLHATDGVELVGEVDGEPVGLIGITWGTDEHPFHAVADLAVDPSLRARGLGRRLLQEAVRWPGHPPIREWRTFVAKRNEPPVRLLQAMGWHEDGMRRFSLVAN